MWSIPLIPLTSLPKLNARPHLWYRYGEPLADFLERIIFMTKIEAIVRPLVLELVTNALDDLGLHGVTVSHVLGSGKQRGQTQHYRGQEYVVKLLDKIKIETVVPDDKVEAVIEAIADAAFTGEIGDGKIFIYKVDDAMRIRTKERGEIAVQ